MLHIEDNDWVKKLWSMNWRVPDQELDQRKLGETMQKDCQACNLNREDAMDCNRWTKQVRDD